MVDTINCLHGNTLASKFLNFELKV